MNGEEGKDTHPFSTPGERIGFRLSSSGILYPFKQILIIVLNIEFLQHLQILVAKRFPCVMFLLVANVIDDRGKLRV